MTYISCWLKSSKLALIMKTTYINQTKGTQDPLVCDVFSFQRCLCKPHRLMHSGSVCVSSAVVPFISIRVGRLLFITLVCVGTDFSQRWSLCQDCCGFGLRRSQCLLPGAGQRRRRPSPPPPAGQPISRGGCGLAARCWTRRCAGVRRSGGTRLCSSVSGPPETRPLQSRGLCAHQWSC